MPNIGDIKVEDQAQFADNRDGSKDYVTGISLQQSLDLDPDELILDPIRWAKFQEVLQFFGKEEDPQFTIDRIYRNKTNDMDRLDYMFSFTRLAKERRELLSKKILKRAERKRLQVLDRELSSFQ